MLQHFFVEEKQCAQRLVLSGGRDIEIAREVSEKLRHFFFCHFSRVTFAVVDNEPLDPIDVTLLCANAVVFAPNHVAHLIK